MSPMCLKSSIPIFEPETQGKIDKTILHGSIITLMKRKIIETRQFTKAVDSFIKKRQLRAQDYQEFKESLANDPTQGDPVPGTGGLQKIRMRSSSKGKRGGFRVCYFYLMFNEHIYLLLIYGKNEQENLSAEETKALKKIIQELKGAQ